MDEFKKWFDRFVKDTQLKIKSGLALYPTSEHSKYLQFENQKLMAVITDYISEFVRILARTTIMYYQLDVVKGETTDICLHNLITSMTVKNPVYSQVMAVFKLAYADQIKILGEQINRVRPRRA
jgi:hypothetical protein